MTATKEHAIKDILVGEEYLLAVGGTPAARAPALNPIRRLFFSRVATAAAS